MISSKLATQLDSLKAIKPRTEWRDRTREILLSQICAQGSQQARHTPAVGQVFAYTRGAFVLAYRQTLEQLFARPMVLSGVLSAAVVASLSIVVASQGSVPGDPLYTVKRTGEQIQVAFVSPETRPSLQLDLAGKRIEELSLISARYSGTNAKAGQTTQLAKEADESISTAQKDLLRLSKETPEKAAAVAVHVKEQTIQSKEQAVKVTPEGESQTPEVAGVIARLDETNGAALQVIVDKKDYAKISDTEVSAHLEEAITDLEARLARLQSVRVAGFQGETAEKAEKAQEVLDEARVSLSRNDFTIALVGINQSRKIIAEGERAVSTRGDADTTGGEGLK